MNTVKIKLTELKFPEKNVRIHTEKQIAEFVRSLEMFGQIRPVVVDENNIILIGNGLAKALFKQGAAEAVCIVKKDLTENEKKKLMIADNKIFSLGLDDADVLYEFINNLGNDLSIPGFDEELLKSMVAEADEVTQSIINYGIADKQTIENINQAAERKDRLMESSTMQNTQPAPKPSAVTYESHERKDDNLIICPKCGEKICL